MNSHSTDTKRRTFLKGAAALAAVPLAAGQVFAQSAGKTNAGSMHRFDSARVAGRRKLGSLEVSSIGLGVQNMHLS
ncbi:MAG: twin-arginine translocation signal domain-containing protein [Xanthomonadales bacterium]|nr:twin-arginine translocation signal domain-containing protein [Xanthomonadales bacterium]